MFRSHVLLMSSIVLAGGVTSYESFSHKNRLKKIKQMGLNKQKKVIGRRKKMRDQKQQSNRQ